MPGARRGGHGTRRSFQTQGSWCSRLHHPRGSGPSLRSRWPELPTGGLGGRALPDHAATSAARARRAGQPGVPATVVLSAGSGAGGGAGHTWQHPAAACCVPGLAGLEGGSKTFASFLRCTKCGMSKRCDLFAGAFSSYVHAILTPTL